MFDDTLKRELQRAVSNDDGIMQATEDNVIVTTGKPAPDVRTRRQPPYAVIVYNDDCHTYEYVIEVLSRVCGYSRQKSFTLAVEIDATGRAVVWSGALEVAELKRDQIRGFGTDFYAREPVTFPLGVDVEPMA